MVQHHVAWHCGTLPWPGLLHTALIRHVRVVLSAHAMRDTTPASRIPYDWRSRVCRVLPVPQLKAAGVVGRETFMAMALEDDSWPRALKRDGVGAD